MRGTRAPLDRLDPRAVADRPARDEGPTDRWRSSIPRLFDTGQRIGILLIGEMDTAGVFRSLPDGLVRVDGQLEEIVWLLEPESAANDPTGCGGLDTDGPEIVFSGPNATYTETGSTGSCGPITFTADLRRQTAVPALPLVGTLALLFLLLVGGRRRLGRRS